MRSNPPLPSGKGDPDLTTLAGGLPGGAVSGRKAIYDALDFQVSKGFDREKINHPGNVQRQWLVAALRGLTTEPVVPDATQVEEIAPLSLLVGGLLNGADTAQMATAVARFATTSAARRSTKIGSGWRR
jgi:hypothetical protein